MVGYGVINDALDNRGRNRRRREATERERQELQAARAYIPMESLWGRGTGTVIPGSVYDHRTLGITPGCNCNGCIMGRGCSVIARGVTAPPPTPIGAEESFAGTSREPERVASRLRTSNSIWYSTPEARARAENASPLRPGIIEWSMDNAEDSMPLPIFIIRNSDSDSEDDDD